MKIKLPNIIPIFPLSGIIFPKTTVPLNIFEPRYLALLKDCINSNKYMGMIQVKKSSSDVYSVGCLGKVTEHKKTRDGRMVVNLTGITRFEIKTEINNASGEADYVLHTKNFQKIWKKKKNYY